MKNKNLPKRKKIRLENFNYKGISYAYFITICTYDKKKHFQNPEIAKTIMKAVEYYKSNLKEIYIYCYCLMPDHLHLIILFTEDYSKSLQNWISSFKRYTTLKIKKSHKINRLWKTNFYDHVIRNDESLYQKAQYILENPVRKKIATDWKDYPYSKFFDDFPM